MNWESLYSMAGRAVAPNPVREFIRLARRPGMISFAGGLPAPELFPREEVRVAADEVLRRHGAHALQYGESDGLPDLRARIADEYERRGVRFAPENILITSGAQQGLDLVGRLFINPRDRVAMENPTYLSLLSCWRVLGAEFEALPANGSALTRGSKLLYLIPNFQNPSGSTMPLERRLGLLKAAGAAGIPVVEDDPYGALRYRGERVCSVLELQQEAGGEVIQLGTFSKVLAPGLRIGWIAAPRPVIEKLVFLKQSSDLHTSTFNQFITLTLLERGVYHRQMEVLRAEYGARLQTMLEALDRHAPSGCTWTRPEGGMFVLLSLPPEMNAAELLPAAVERDVIFVPGAPFHITGGANTMRLNFSNPGRDQIETGVKRLAEVISDYGAAGRKQKEAVATGGFPV